MYLMAALLSATAEKNPAFAWDLNMNVVSRFEFGESRKDQKIFGHLVLPFLTYNPKENTPQYDHGAVYRVWNQ
jgi:hypothetical protein